MGDGSIKGAQVDAKGMSSSRSSNVNGVTLGNVAHDVYIDQRFHCTIVNRLRFYGSLDNHFIIAFDYHFTSLAKE